MGLKCLSFEFTREINKQKYRELTEPSSMYSHMIFERQG